MRSSIPFLAFRGHLLALVLILSFCENVFAQYFELKHQRNREATSFKLINNLIIIPLMINGKGPFNFVLDTGVGIVLITEPKLIDSLNASQTREIRLNGIGEGDEMIALIHPSARIDIGNSISGTMPVAILKEEAFNLSSFVGMPIYGLIGYELFSSFIVQINYSLKTLTYYKQETAFIPRKGTKVPISIEDRKPYVQSKLLFPGNKEKLVKLIIDTGAGHPLSLETEDGIPYEIPDKHISANLGVGLSGLIKGYIARIPEMKLGKFQLDNIICAFPDYQDVAAKIPSIYRNGNMGNNILKRFNVVFDYSREWMYLKPNYAFNTPFEHDMSGMELASNAPYFDVIHIVRVEPQSAADQVGLKTGDRLLSVNFKKISELDVEEIYGTFKSRDGKGIILEVLPKGLNQSKFVILVLKKQI
ncbi:MAG: aspartyl protease family protein [Pyrinomonadaceae bacterium]|nr:aspartyl protease family protein [Sphingobacteriaceae bacterium]